ncbi:hypothetical protein GCM10022226_83040 [Sphaerisporangium flaviroseum]|uniref:Tyr recombinase domain-containing protein n=1 Tax=Sphaerisporangium flaviroseum TaxID=509199 RepID=A0ABP7JLF2_9ACTN
MCSGIVELGLDAGVAILTDPVGAEPGLAAVERNQVAAGHSKDVAELVFAQVKRKPGRFASAAFIERSTGGLVLGPPKSKAGRRAVGLPKAIVPALREHLKTYVRDGPDALMFPGAKGGPLRRSGFNTRTRWVDVVKEMGLPGLHFHDLRHTGVPAG